MARYSVRPLTAADFGNGEAAHICLDHCPVRQQCLNDAVAAGPTRRRCVVLAGIIFDHDGQPIPTQTPATRCRLCPGARGDVIDERRERRREQWRRSGARRRAEAAVVQANLAYPRAEVSA